MERHIAALTLAQRRQGVRVTEVYNSGEPSGEAVQLLRGWKTHRLRPHLLRAALFYSAMALQTMDFSDDRIRVLHVHGDWHSFLLGSMVGQKFGVKLVAASLHSALHAPVRRYAQALRSCDPIFTTGAIECRILSEALGRPSVHLPSAPADLFFRQFSGAAETADVIAVGSLLPVKHLELLLECAARRPKLQFAIVGEGPELHRLQRLKEELHLANVQFRGPLSEVEVQAALCRARLFINTSLTEGSPTAALEAMACGLPVVLTPSNDYSAIVKQGVNGRITAGWDATELVGAIDEFLENPEFLATAGTRSRRVAEAHRWDEKARIVTDAMLAALDRKRGRVT